MRIGNETFELTKETCEKVLHGFYYPPLGCVINASQPHTEKNGDIFIFPLKTKKYPVVIEKELFSDLTTDAGRFDNVYTHVLG